jgi:hypothetical protein
MNQTESDMAKSVDGRLMLLVTLLLVLAIAALAVLAGPFGRELTIKQQPVAHWSLTKPTVAASTHATAAAHTGSQAVSHPIGE